ncbi:response regulator [Geomonas nitrogeniifigens]|uniref:histidine kinase n=1 Tax=Geomonas diazotrophica TaxID=2843197 RepID=A0ABX8JJ56_9BACT|nr:ATP-binding protein [Geomonas nitrogeniifigens]QWV97327.1 response regulator [Geomonas nitrogeniifigens]
MATPRIYCCEALGPEVRGALSGGSLAGAECTTFTGCCGRPPVSWDDLRRLCGGSPAIVVGGECLGHLGAPPDDLLRTRLVKKRHCAALVCGDYAFDRLTGGGGYLVTPGWLAGWRSFVEGWGFDQSTGADFFAESCARITLVDTGSCPESAGLLQEFGAFVQRPVESVPVGLELLSLQLERAHGELERQVAVDAAPAPASDYALLLDLLSRVSSCSGEQRVIEELLSVFGMLFGARETAFIPGNGGPLYRHGEAVTQDRTLRKLATEVQGSFEVAADAAGFLVRLSHNGLVGWLWSGHFALPQHLQRYLNLAASAANVCAMAIVSARTVSHSLKESEDKYRLLFENMGNGFALLKMLLGPMGTPADFRFVEVNPAFEAFTGRNEEDLVGRTMLELLPNFESSQLESLGLLAREGTPLALERYFFNGKCCQVWLFRPRPGYCGMIINDITKQKLLEDKLRQSIKMESVGRLAGGVAHEFNNMLSVIIGYAEMLEMEYQGNRRIADTLKEICKAAQRSRDLTAQLLSFSRQQLISPKMIDVNQALGELARKVSLLAGRETRVSLKLCREPWPVKIDPAQLEEIVSNIVSNAGAAMPGGGDLVIGTGNITVGEELCSTNIDAAPGEYLEITISDSGHGMDGETCRHIFEPFFTTREVGQGNGLGLATVYGMVTQNGGFVTVESERGVGTTFKVCLPRHQYRVQEAKPVPAGGGTGTVLVVEDDEIVGRMTVKMLEHMGYRVLLAGNAMQALELCRSEHRIDLVLSDVMLPGASGKDAVETILALRPDLKVIYMSGYAPETLLDKGVDRSRVNFIQKPFDMASLDEKIKAALTGSFATA